VAAALRQLRQLDTDKYEEARRNPYITGLPVETQRLLSGEQVHGQEETDVHGLIRSRNWSELRDLLQPHVEASDYTLEDVIFLFQAWWGLGNEQELQACGKNVIKRFYELLAIRKLPCAPEFFPQLQIMALIFWKIGEGDKARRILDLLLNTSLKWPKESIFSYWHLKRILGQRCKEDCDRLRELFKGETISPPFLRKEPAVR
jgi:hypothetical protein